MTRIIVYLAAAVLIAATGADAANLQVNQRDRQFDQEQVTVNGGDTITFRNDDTVSHNIMTKSPTGRRYNSGVQAPGESITLTFDEAGEYEIICGIHPKMKMTVTVK
jgi:cytochrome c peroxidase